MAKKLTQEEELELVKEFQKTGDKKTFLKLQRSLKPLIRSIIKQRMPNNSEMTEGQLAIRVARVLPDVLRNYNPNQTQLNTYLMNTLPGHITNAVSENKIGAHIPRPEQAKVFHYRQAKRQAQLEFGNNPTPEQILSMNRSKLKDVSEVKRLAQYDKKTLIGDQKFGNESDGYVQFKDQFLQSNDTNKEQTDALKLDQIKKVIKEDFSPEQQVILNTYLFEGKSIMETALSKGFTHHEVRKTLNLWKKKVKEKNL